jgi:hypothetical protein
VASAIAEEIKGELSTDGGTPMLSSASGSEVPAANEAFMRARFVQSDETAEGLLAAFDHYGEAVEADPTFAAAYAGLASTELMLGMSQASDGRGFNHRHLSGSAGRVELRLRARLGADSREFYPGGPATPGGGGRLGDGERAGGLDGPGLPDFGSAAAQGGGAY